MTPEPVQNETIAAADDKEALSDDEIRRLRYDANREEDGSALDSDRDTMYDDLTDVGESGTQGDKTGREDQNTIGPNG